MRTPRTRWRLPGSGSLLIVPAATFAVHQLRYTLAYGSHAGAQLSQQGHVYLQSVAPWMALALALGFSAFLRRAVTAARTGETRLGRRASATALWTVTTVGLIAVYAVQEALEELYAAGHPTGLGGIFGHGGWWAIPSAAIVAILVVALLRLGRAVLGIAARRATHSPRLRPLSLRRPTPALVLALAPLASSAAGRAPPLR